MMDPHPRQQWFGQLAFWIMSMFCLFDGKLIGMYLLDVTIIHCHKGMCLKKRHTCNSPYYPHTHSSILAVEPLYSIETHADTHQYPWSMTIVWWLLTFHDVIYARWSVCTSMVPRDYHVQKGFKFLFSKLHSVLPFFPINTVKFYLRATF